MPINIYLQILFFVTELSLLLFKRAKKSAVKNERDRKSLIILWLVIALSLSLGPFSVHYGIWAFNNYQLALIIGIIVFAIGFIIRWTAIYQLGKMFTVDVVISDTHTLKTSGLYKIVRHPSYSGLILIIGGLGVCLGSLLSFLLMFIPTFLAINYRIKIEEKALIEEFGEQYTSYKSRVKKLIPGIY
jgi:protein-S-isoprenylcysteine O-methyltransferase Ste14